MVFLSLCPFLPFFRLRNLDRLCHVAAHLQKVEPLSWSSQRAAQNAGRSSTPAYTENEWQLAASAAQDAFGVSAPGYSECHY